MFLCGAIELLSVVVYSYIYVNTKLFFVSYFYQGGI